MTRNVFTLIIFKLHIHFSKKKIQAIKILAQQRSGSVDRIWSYILLMTARKYNDNDAIHSTYTLWPLPGRINPVGQGALEIKLKRQLFLPFLLSLLQSLWT